MLNADELLDYLRGDGLVFQSKLSPSPINKFCAWQTECGSTLNTSVINHLRRRGQIAISEGVTYRYLKAIDTKTLCRCTEGGSDPI